MADLKISQLTGATTPLAGTEVLPIVQSSSTKKVSVANLTAGRAVSMSTLAVGSTTPTAGYQADIIGRGRFAPSASNYLCDFISPESNNTSVQLYADNAGASVVVGGTAAKPLSVYIGGAERTVVDTSGNYKINNGNLVIGTAGKGIDFSSASGGFIASTRGQTVAAGSSTTTLFTLSNVSSNRMWHLSVRQSGANNNTVVAQIISYGSGCGALRIAQDNTNPALDMDITTSGLNVQLVLASGFGSTTWDWVLTELG
jgi:hypothetical protein